MKRSVFDTLACKAWRVQPIILEYLAFEIKNPRDVYISNLEKPMDNYAYNGYLKGLEGDNAPSVSMFSHPLVMHLPKGDLLASYEISRSPSEEIYPSNEIVSIIDVRQFTKRDVAGRVAVTAHNDFKLTVLRGIMSRMYVVNHPTDFLNLGIAPLGVFSRWISENLNRRFALTADVQIRSTVITAFYYLCQFNSHKIAEDKVKYEEYLVSCATRIAKVTSSVESILPIIENCGFISDINGYIQALKSHSGTERFEPLTAAFLFANLSGSWYGFNFRELVNVAVEHPPTFIAMLYMAADERGYRNTALGKILKDTVKPEDLKIFLRNVDQLLLA